MGENDFVKSTIIESLAISSGLSAEGGTGSARPYRWAQLKRVRFSDHENP